MGVVPSLQLRPLPSHAKFLSSPVGCRIFGIVADEGMLVALTLAWELHLKVQDISGCTDVSLMSVFSSILPLLLLRHCHL